MGKERLVGLTLLRPEWTSNDFFSFFQTCLNGTKFTASFNNWSFNSVIVPQKSEIGTAVYLCIS